MLTPHRKPPAPQLPPKSKGIKHSRPSGPNAKPGGRKPVLSEAEIREQFLNKGYFTPDLLDLLDQCEFTTFWFKDPDGRFVWANTAFVLHNGVGSRGELIGLTDFDVTDPAHATQYVLDDQKVLQGERIPSRIESVGRIDKTTFWSVTSKVPVRNRKGRIIGTAGASHPYTNEGEQLQQDEPLSQVTKFISQHFHEPIDRTLLAKLSGMSLRDFHRKFREAYGTSPHEFVRQLRVRKSCHLLVYTRKTLSQVASEVGYSDQSHFTREFHSLIGEPPGLYRARHQNAPRGG